MKLGALAACRLDAFDDGLDVLERARRTLVRVMRGTAGPNAEVRLRAAVAVLAPEFARQVSDEDLMAEVKRRATRP